MNSFVRASSGACDPVKIQRWIRTWMDDGPATGTKAGEKDELRAVELVHDADKQPVTAWQINRRTNIQQLSNEIADRAKEDAQGIGDDRARYILQPYFGQSGNPNGRATFHVQVADPYPEGGDDGTGMTEGPSPKGERAMTMRLTNEAYKIGLGGAATSMRMLQDENHRLCSEGATLRQELRDMGEKVRQYENESFERAIKWRKTLFWEKAREEMLKQVIPFVGMVGGAVMTRVMGVGQSGALPPANPQLAAPVQRVVVPPGGGFPMPPSPPDYPPTPSPSPPSGGGPASSGTVGPAQLAPAAQASPDQGQGQTQTQTQNFSSFSMAAAASATGSVDGAGKPTIEARLRRLWNALALAQRMAMPMAFAKHPGIEALQRVAAQGVVELLMAPNESVRPYADAPSQLEIQAASLFGTFNDAAWKQLMDLLLNDARWSKEQVGILTSIVRDLGKRDQAFDASIETQFPTPPEPIVAYEMKPGTRSLMGPTRDTPNNAFDPKERTGPEMPGTPKKVPEGPIASEKPAGKSGKPARGKAVAPPQIPAARKMPALPPRKR